MTSRKKFQVHYENKVLVLVLLFNRTKSLAFKMKIFQLYLDLKVLLTWTINPCCTFYLKGFIDPVAAPLALSMHGVVIP